MTSIRAYATQAAFITNMQKNVEAESLAWVLGFMIKNWLALRFDVLGAFLTFFIYLLLSLDKTFLPTGYALIALNNCSMLPAFCNMILNMLGLVSRSYNFFSFLN